MTLRALDIHIASLFSDVHHFISISTRDESSITRSIDSAIFDMIHVCPQLVNNPVDNRYERITLRNANWQYLQRACKKVRQHTRPCIEPVWKNIEGKSKHGSTNSFDMQVSIASFSPETD